MDGESKNSAQLGYPFESKDLKYISGLSTILVATIEEAKDRISQIEYIFCSQLYSNFQTKCKSLQNIYSEAKKAAEDGYREKENDLLLKIEQIQHEKERVLEENKSLKLEKVKSSEEEEMLQTKLKMQQSLIDNLEEELMQKSKEIDQGIELQNKLLQLIQSKDKQYKEREEKSNAVVEKVKSLENNIGDLQKELVDKHERFAKETSLNHNLFKKIEMQALDILNYEQLLDKHGKEKGLLVAKLNHLEGNMVKLQDELRRKTHDAPEVSELHRQLMQQTEWNGSEMKKNVKLLAKCEKEKMLLMSKVKSLEEKVDELNMSLRKPSSDANESRELNEKLLEQIESRASELLAEKKKRRDTVDAYKRLKSQYNFLCKKFGLTAENMQLHIKSEDLIDSTRDRQTPLSRPDLENKGNDHTSLAYDKNIVQAEISSNDDMDGGGKVQRLQGPSPNLDIQAASKSLTDSKSDESKVKTEISLNYDMGDEKGGKLQGRNCQPQDHVNPLASKSLLNSRNAPVAGIKRRASGWIDTRFRQRQLGPDPHDDFLDTPLEEIRGNLNKATIEARKDNPVVGPKDVDLGSSDDETQDLSAEMQHKDKIPDVNPGKRGFKYVETVRKKAERETLKGFECKQCKKFYDAVIPNDEAGDGNTSNRSFRCEHHDGVSRHRYRYVPPMTPEGFWNIGFESEM